MSMTYAQLTTAIQDYTENAETSFVDHIPDFIRNTETVVNNTVQLPALRKNVLGETTIGFPYIDLPSDFLSDFSIAVKSPSTGEYSYLVQKDVEYIREAYSFPTVTGQPKHYTLFSNTSVLLGPTPDLCYPVEMHYFAYPQSITLTVSGTSWLGDNFPNVLLWGALVEAYIYMKGEQDVLQMYQSKFEEAITLLKQLGDGKDRQDMYRVTQTRQGVQ